MIVTIASGKGGVGKTTTVLALAAVLAAHPSRHRLGVPIVLDLDPRADATRGAGVQSAGTRVEQILGDAATGGALEVYEVMRDEAFAIVPGSAETAYVEARVFGGANGDERVRRRLREVCAGRLALIDTAPGFDRALTRGAIGAADVLVIPVVPEPFSAEGALDVLEVVRRFPDADPTIITIATMVESRRVLTTRVLGELSEAGFPVDGVVPRAVAAAEAPLQGRSIVAYAARSPVTREYEKIAEHIFAIVKMSRQRTG